MLYVGLLEAPYSDVRRTLIGRFWITASLMVATALGLALIMVSRITRPLKNLSRAAHEMAQGNWDQPVGDSPTYLEMANLNQAFRGMQQAISERDRRLRDQNAQLAETNANYMKMLGFITHELKSPTAAIQMRIDALIESFGKEIPDQLAQSLVRIQRNCQEMQDMIRDYLDLSRAERGELSAHKTEIDLRTDVVAPSVSLHQSLLASRNIRLDVDCPEGLALEADPELARILLGNLLSNAAKYGREGGKARIEAQRIKEQVRVCVWNEGPGFSQEEREVLFRKFSRLRKPSTRDKRGTGLGLFLCREIVELHGGSIRAESEPGQWARFCFSLPRPERTDQPQKASSGGSRSASGAGAG